MRAITDISEVILASTLIDNVDTISADIFY